MKPNLNNNKKNKNNIIVIAGMLLLLVTIILVLVGTSITITTTTATATTTLGTTNEETSAASSPSGRNNMTTTEPIKFLAIQTAQTGTLSQINATTYTLELRNVSNKTILFSDRPDRIVTSQSTSDFIGNWTVGEEDSFAADPPNTVLVVDSEEILEGVVIELFNPIYDAVTNTLKYDIIMIAENATTSFTPQNEIGQSILIIDDTSHAEGGGDTSTSGDTSHAEG